MEKQEFNVGDIVRIESDLSKYKGRTGTVVKYAGSRRRNLVRVRLRNGTETQFAECNLVLAGRRNRPRLVCTPREFANQLLDDLGKGPTTVNGDRSSHYFIFARVKDDDSIQAVAALIENKALLKPGEQYYSIHVIDNISMSDCNLYSTGDLSRAGLVNALKEIFKEVENRQK